MCQKWSHYPEIYHCHSSPFRGSQPTVVEFGIKDGGSLQLWKEYFGKGVTILGIDINPNCKTVEENSIHVWIGDKSNKPFLKKLVNEIGPIVILIDDGAHE